MIYIEPSELHSICVVMEATMLILGGLSDYRKWVIPNSVPLALVLSGLADPIFRNQRIVACGLMILAFIVLVTVFHRTYSGGDVKLVIALSMAMDLVSFAVVILAVGILCFCMNIGSKKGMECHIPMCTYVTLAFLTLNTFISENMQYFSSFLLLYVVLLCATKRYMKVKEKQNSGGKNNEENYKNPCARYGTRDDDGNFRYGGKP